MGIFVEHPYRFGGLTLREILEVKKWLEIYDITIDKLHEFRPEYGEKIKEKAGIKHDQGKSELALLPFDGLSEIAKVLTHGATKYSPHNWRQGFKWSRLISATLRHLFAWISGEDKDPETGLSHLAHAGCNILFLIEHELKGYGEDDRHTNT